MKPKNLWTGEEHLLGVLSDILHYGTRKANRTGVDTLFMAGHIIRHDFRRDAFPLLTTKKMAFNQIKGELLGFIRGCTNAADFRALGCTLWDKNANENKTWLKNPRREGTDDLGRVYGAQWRNWSGGAVGVDQLRDAIQKLYVDPTDRRNIVSAWNPTEIHAMALPPCHLLWQLIADPIANREGPGELHMTMYMRSCDMFLGIPFNLASYALLLKIICALCGWTPGTLTMFLADAHIYINHIDQVKEQLSRDVRELPILNLNMGLQNNAIDALCCLASIQPNDISLSQYNPHPSIKAEMAV